MWGYTNRYGYGGKKRGIKRNDASSSADMTGFSQRKNKDQTFTQGGRGSKAKGAAKRPGKQRRQQMRK